MDFYVKGPLKIAVEIKVNYIDNKEIADANKPLPPRINKDFDKYELLDGKADFLLLISTFFESKEGFTKYIKHIDSELQERSDDMGLLKWNWYDCSIQNSYNALLAISDSDRLPTEKTISKE